MAYPTVTQHSKVYPFTSIMASPYSCDPTGVTDCAAAFEQIKANQLNIGTIYIPHGTFKIAANLTIPSTIALLFEKGGSLAIATGITLTINGYILAGPFQIFTGAGTVSINAVNLIQFGIWSGNTGTIIQGALSLASTLDVVGALTITGAVTLSTLSSAGLVKTSAAGVLAVAGASDLPTGIDAAKIGAGGVSNTEFSYLDGATSNLQAQIDVLSAVATIPIGAVVEWLTETAPSGWLECNGAAVSRVTYAALFAVIATTYGVGDGSTTFNLPDFRGRFTRGWAHGQTTDPDKASRTNRGDGTTGDHVGTKQATQLASHYHEIGSIRGNQSIGSAYRWEGSYIAGDSEATTDAFGGNESRPVNINVMKIIKAS